MTIDEFELNAVKEDVAVLAHQQWSSWMTWMFSQGYYRNIELNGVVQCCWVMPSTYRENIERQVATDFYDLSQAERDSDYKEADKVMDILRRHQEKG